jgi:hypothetical protein
MKMGENWRQIGKYLHKLDVVIVVIMAAGIIWFVRSHWKNRLTTA